MAPNVTTTPAVLEHEDQVQDFLIPGLEKYNGYPKEIPGAEYKRQLVWRNIILFAYLHVAAIYGGYLMFTAASWPTFFFGKFH